jgi:hypothetical protein
MDDRFAPLGDDREEVEGTYAEGRRADRTYASRSFADPSAAGAPARFIYKVFDPESDTTVESYGEDGTQYLLRESPAGRVQVKLLVSGAPGNVTKIMIQRVRNLARGPRAETVLTLEGAPATTLIELLRGVEHVPVEGEDAVRVDDALVREVFSSPESLSQLYERDRDLFRQLISDDATARDVIAMRRRRSEVERFRRLLDDPEYFVAAAAEAHGPEAAWQRFFEDNPWVLGTGLGGQLFTSWDDERLQQVVAGSSIAHEGKRADALMRTSGVIRWLTFGEFKTHETPLLDAKEYRPGVWHPSKALVGGVAQSQTTVQRAVEDLRDIVRATAADGSDIPDDIAFLTRPRSYLIAGHLDQLLGEFGGPHREKIRSFELYRRSVVEPEIVTYDELLARAEWVVDTEEGGE